MYTIEQLKIFKDKIAGKESPSMREWKLLVKTFADEHGLTDREAINLAHKVKTMDFQNEWIKHIIVLEKSNKMLQNALEKAPKPYSSYQWHGSMQVFSDAYSAWSKFVKEVLAETKE